MAIPQDGDFGPFATEADFEAFRLAEEEEARAEGYGVLVLRAEDSGHLFAHVWYSEIDTDPARAVLAAAPPPAAGAPPLTPYDLDTLTRTLWGEARGEPKEGQVAVVQVVRNRVLRKGTDAATECRRDRQFSCWFDRQAPKLKALDPASAIYQQLAAVVVEAWGQPDITDGACHYYAPAGMPGGRAPSWAAQGTETLRKGGHIFFKGVPW